MLSQHISKLAEFNKKVGIGLQKLRSWFRLTRMEQLLVGISFPPLKRHRVIVCHQESSLVCVCLEVSSLALVLCRLLIAWFLLLFQGFYVIPCWLFLEWSLSSKQRYLMQLGLLKNQFGFSSVA